MKSSLERGRTTKTVGRAVGIGLVLVCLLVPLTVVAQQGVPIFINPNETPYQNQTHFLTFTGSYVPENAATGKAYYAAIDPNNTKPTFATWLVNAGFIANASQWHPYGKQLIACNLPGCDFPAGTYGDNIINTDSHAIVLNAADLGFVRNQFIRCKPSCSASNPKIYTYLENYPIVPFTGTFNPTTGVCTPTPGINETTASCFAQNQSAYPTAVEADAAIASAITRPLGVLGGDGVSVCPASTSAVNPCIERIADVAFEWAPPATNPTSTSRFGQLYAFIFAHPTTDLTTTPPTITTIETTDFPDFFSGKTIMDPVTKLNTTIHAGATAINGHNDKFAPNLDGFGFKNMPGVCLICHGGQPQKLTSAGTYPRGGNLNGFRFLPLDNRNLLFELPGNTYSLANQELQIKAYNQEVLLTIPKTVEDDGTGATRQAHIRETITGWYAADGSNYSNDTSMGASKQNSNFIPKGWRQPPNGTAPVGAEAVYLNVLGPSCRSCHFNREVSLDFGTYANFHQGSDILQLGLIVACKQFNPDPPDPGAQFMPAAHLTFQRYWQTQSGTQFLQDGFPLYKVPDQLANDFGMGSVAGYCATNP